MSRFILAPQAARDIEQIVQYIAKESVNAALDLEDQLLENFRHLASFPTSGHTRNDLAGDRDLLFWPTGKYLILYRAKAAEIEIAAVLHPARDIPKILSQREPVQ